MLAKTTVLFLLNAAISAVEYVGVDKAEHFVVGGAIGFVSASITHYACAEDAPEIPAWERRVIAYAPGVVAGIGKELYDLRHRDRHTPEVMDAVWTIAGTACAVEMTFALCDSEFYFTCAGPDVAMTWNF